VFETRADNPGGEALKTVPKGVKSSNNTTKGKGETGLCEMQEMRNLPSGVGILKAVSTRKPGTGDESKKKEKRREELLKKPVTRLLSKESLGRNYRLVEQTGIRPAVKRDGHSRGGVGHQPPWKGGEAKHARKNGGYQYRCPSI